MTTHKAIIIAAGRGRRLAPYTDQVPKCLVPVDHRTILEIQLEAMRHHGIREAVIIRGYLGDVLESRASALPLPVRFIDNPNWEHNNILESLFCAGDELEGNVLLTYSDIVYTRDVVGAAVQHAGDYALVIDRDFRDAYQGRSDHPLSEAEVADLDDRGAVARVGKRALPPEKAWGEFIGLLRLSAAASRRFRDEWASLRDSLGEDQPFQRAATFRNAYLTDFLQHLVDQGVAMNPVEIRGQWREIDTVQDLDRARELLQRESW